VPASDRLQPSRLAPLFVLTALIHAAAIVTRFDVVRAMLPELAHAAVLCAALPLLLITGYLESRLDYGPTMPGFPVWMQINSRPVKWSLTLAFTYLAVVALQTLDLSFGPVDPTPPEQWPTAVRAQWFFTFTFGMAFANYLAATRFLVPALRLLSKPLRYLPTLVALLILTALGLGLGLAALQAIAARQDPRFTQLIGDYATVREDPILALALTLATIAAPMLLGWLLRGRRRPDAPKPTKPAEPRVKPLDRNLATPLATATPSIWRPSLPIVRASPTTIQISPAISIRSTTAQHSQSGLRLFKRTTAMMLSLRTTLRSISLLVATIAFAPGCDDGQIEALGLTVEDIDAMSEEELDELAALEDVTDPIGPADPHPHTDPDAHHRPGIGHRRAPAPARSDYTSWMRSTDPRRDQRPGTARPRRPSTPPATIFA
jgi:hypothetical protein